MAGIRSEIQGGWHVAWIADQLFGKDEIAGQRIENVLPGADGIRIAQDKFPSLRDCSYNIRHKTIVRPVAPPDHVAGTHGSDSRSTAGQIAFSERGCEKLSTG